MPSILNEGNNLVVRKAYQMTVQKTQKLKLFRYFVSKYFT
jgi:hypothetical protein